jgi:hypothetical protein
MSPLSYTSHCGSATIWYARPEIYTSIRNYKLLYSLVSQDSYFTIVNLTIDGYIYIITLNIKMDFFIHIIFSIIV